MRRNPNALASLRNTRPADDLRAGNVRHVIDGRFSPKAFEDSEDAEALAATLRDEVVLAVQPAIQTAMKAVVEQLNGLGHQLIDEQLSDPNEVCYDTPEGAAVRLYVCHDTTVSAGTRRNRTA
jgi:hypothetical protein